MTNLNSLRPASVAPPAAGAGERAPAIDFVVSNPGAYSSVSCDARLAPGTAGGSSYTATGELTDNKAYVVPLDKLLRGPDGAYQVSCTAKDARTGESHRAEMEAVKFTRGDPGTSALSYQDGKGYGVAAAPSGRLDTCYLPNSLSYDENCLAQHYGNQDLYLKQVETQPNVQAHQRQYASGVGVFLEANPRGPQL